MLYISKERKMAVLAEHWSKRVSERVEHFYKLTCTKEYNRNCFSRILDIAKEINIKATEVIDAHFELFPLDACKKIWTINYPPLNVASGGNAITRALKWKLATETTPVHKRVWSSISSGFDLVNAQENHPNPLIIIKLSLQNGSLSTLWLAYCIEKKVISEKVATTLCLMDVTREKLNSDRKRIISLQDNLNGTPPNLVEQIAKRLSES